MKTVMDKCQTCKKTDFCSAKKEVESCLMLNGYNIFSICNLRFTNMDIINANREFEQINIDISCGDYERIKNVIHGHFCTLQGIDQEWYKVKSFHELFNHPVSEKPKMMDIERVNKRVLWMLEEINEFVESCDIYNQVDAMIDLIYFALGTLVELGVKPKKIFDIVHNANMKKANKDGSVKYRPDGKVEKSPDWKDPLDEIKKEIDSQ